jgi:hypothetical protein
LVNEEVNAVVRHHTGEEIAHPQDAAALLVDATLPLRPPVSIFRARWMRISACRQMQNAFDWLSFLALSEG